MGLLANDEVAQAMLFTEETGATLDSVTFFVFWAILLGPEFKHLSWHSSGKSPPPMETKPADECRSRLFGRL